MASELNSEILGKTLIVAQSHDTDSTATGTADSGHTTKDAEHVATDAHAASGEMHATTEAHGGEEHSDVFPPFDPSTWGSQLLWLALAFGGLYLLMSRIALPRIGEILEVRRDRIEGDLAEAERMRQKTDQAIESYEADLAAAKSKAQGIAEETRANVKAGLDTKRKAVEADLAKKMATAETRIQKSKSDAMANVGDIAADTAQALVAQLTGKVTIKAARDAVAKASKE